MKKILIVILLATMLNLYAYDSSEKAEGVEQMKEDMVLQILIGTMTSEEAMLLLPIINDMASEAQPEGEQNGI